MVAASAALLLLLAIRTWGQSSSPAAEDPVAELQRRIDTGQATLEFEADQGYLRSLLKNLNVPVASQGFVFTKSSFQLSLISPQTPRAIYFNDDVYVGFEIGRASCRERV